MTANENIVILGAGHAGVQLAASLRDEGYAGEIVLVSDEPHIPYQRPPLSKAFMQAPDANVLLLRGESFFEQQKINLLKGERAESVDCKARTVHLASGKVLSYTHLVFATGAEPRVAPFAGADLKGVHVLRNLDDAALIRSDLAKATHAVIIGAGFIGLEFAATAAKTLKHIDVIEAAPRVMGRAVSTIISDFYAQAHDAFGVRLHLNTGVTAIEGEDGHVSAVRLADGRILPADLVVVGIGVVAADGLARAAGIICSNGIETDSAMLTSDPNVSAIGDCVFHPNVFGGCSMRLESVQNASDQARIVARRITGKNAHYDALPWFWSDQGDLKLQIAGLIAGCNEFVTRGDFAARSFSVFAFRDGALRCVESVNRAADHMAARRLLVAQPALTLAQFNDPAFDLRAAAQAAGVRKPPA